MFYYYFEQFMATRGNNSSTALFIYVFIILVTVITIFLFIREIVGWYFKINKLIALQEKQIELLQEQNQLLKQKS